MNAMLRKGLVAGGAAAALATAIVVPALAQDDASGDEQQVTVDAREFAERGVHRAAFAEALADELGLETDRVAEAIEAVVERHRAERRDGHMAVMQERLDAAVESGELSRDQADAMMAARERGVLPFDRDGRMERQATREGRRGGPGVHGFGHRGGPFGGDAG